MKLTKRTEIVWIQRLDSCLLEFAIERQRETDQDNRDCLDSTIGRMPLEFAISNKGKLTKRIGINQAMKHDSVAAGFPLGKRR